MSDTPSISLFKISTEFTEKYIAFFAHFTKIMLLKGPEQLAGSADC